MRRRGFLGFLGGAAVAGPSMAKQAIASGLEGMHVNGLGTMLVEKGANFGMGYASATGDPVDGRYDPLEWPKRELADFLGRSASDLLRERLETHVGQLDPDIACMQSIALQAKIRMQRDRTFERNRTQQRRWLERQVQDAIKRLTP